MSNNPESNARAAESSPCCEPCPCLCHSRKGMMHIKACCRKCPVCGRVNRAVAKTFSAEKVEGMNAPNT